MTIDPLEKLMAQLLQLMAPDMSEEAQGLAAYIEAEESMEEVGEDGNPTTKAHRARTRIKNRFFVEETNEKSRHKTEAQAFKAREKFAEVMGQAVLRYAKLRTHERKLEMLDKHQTKRPVIENSREEHDPESAFALAFPLIEMLMKEGASPSSIGRLPQIAHKFIASLIKAHARDPKLEDPANPWVLLAQAGLLDGYRKDLSHEECKVLAYAFSQRFEATSEWAAKARSELDLPPGFSATFLKAAECWADSAKALDPGVVRAYWEAHSLAIERDIELLGQVLGLDSQTDLMSLTVVSHYFHRVKPRIDDDTRYTISLVAMKQAIDNIEPHKKWQGDWVREVVNLLPGLAQNLAGSTDSIEAFNLLFVHGLRLSEARDGFDARARRRAEEEAAERLEASIREACEFGVRFKIDNDLVVWEEYDGYEDIDAEIWTRERWIAVHGELPGGQELDVEDESASHDVPCRDEEDGDDDGEGNGKPAYSGDPDRGLSLDRHEHHESSDEDDADGAEAAELEQTLEASGDHEIENFDWQDENPDLSDVIAAAGLDRSIFGPEEDDSDDFASHLDDESPHPAELGSTPDIDPDEPVPSDALHCEPPVDLAHSEDGLTSQEAEQRHPSEPSTIQGSNEAGVQSAGRAERYLPADDNEDDWDE